LNSRYEVVEWNVNIVPSYWCYIYVAGDLDITKQVCRRFAFPSGLCVTVESVSYVFGGGQEEGVRIGLIQYPPFQEEPIVIRGRAIRLGRDIAEENYQWSYTIIDSSEVRHYSRRNESN